MSARPIRDERGIALTVAVFAIVLIGIFSAVLASAAVQLSDTSSQDRDDKSAFQAAQAGLSAGFHRLNAQGTVGVPNLLDLAELGVHVQCVGLGPVNALANLDECPRPDGPGIGGEGTAGTGTRYEFVVTPVLAGPDCNDGFTPSPQDLVNRLSDTLADVVTGLLRVESGEPDPLFVYRCITATGKTLTQAGGVTSQARLQERVASVYGLVSNIVGTEEVLVEGGSTIMRPLGAVASSAAGVVGTNGTVRIDGGVVQTNVSHPDPSPERVQVSGGGAHVGQIVEHQPPWFLPRVNPGNSAQSNSNGWTQCLNINLLLVRFTGCELSRNQLKINGMNLLGVNTANAVTLRPGIHNYCSVTIEGGRLATLVTMVEARVFIDPANCPSTVPAAERGKLIIRGPVEFVSLNEAEPYSGFFVKGDPPDGKGVVIDGSGALPVQAVKASVYAPETTIEVKNLAKVLGALYGRRVEFKNASVFAELPLVGETRVNILGGVQSTYARTGWVQCRSTPPDPNDRESC